MGGRLINCDYMCQTWPIVINVWRGGGSFLFARFIWVVRDQFPIRLFTENKPTQSKCEMYMKELPGAPHLGLGAQFELRTFGQREAIVS